MNLSVIHYDKTSKRHIMRLNRGRFAGREFAVDMAVCEKPLCPCCKIDFACTPVSDGTPSPDDSRVYRFALDTGERQIASRHKLDRESLYLAKQLVAELEDADWHALYSHLVQVKREQLRAADIEELNVEFPADVLADPTLMVPYSVFFSFEPNFQFLVKDRKWLIDCQFCVNPDCDCRDTYITFIPLPDSPGSERTVDEHLPDILYNYKTSRYRIYDPPEDNQPAMDEIITRLKEKYPDINSTLEKRHDLLRKLYKKASGYTRRPAAIAADKIGRNDPCPCGSGKKYKKCCGR